MGDGLDYFDRPKYPACKDRRCSAYLAGIPHVVDESHQDVLDTLPPLQWNMRDMGDRPSPRSVYLRAEDMRNDRAMRMARLVRIAGLSVMGVGLLVLFVSLLMLGSE